MNKIDIKDIFGENSTSIESRILFSDKDLESFDYLLFVDSRGIVNDVNKVDNSYIFKLIEIFNIFNFKYLIISRPKNLTVFATLYNFLNVNRDLKFKYLITNLGFVDCTPKKQANIEDIYFQISQFSDTKNKTISYENYELSNGKIEILNSIEYSKLYLAELNNLLSEKFEKSYFINTPLVPMNAHIERKRPTSFFTQLEKTNDLVEELVKIGTIKNSLIDIKDLNITYDGVHYTKEGHQKVFNKIRESIKI